MVAVETFCSYFKYGYCKYGENCSKRHNTSLCMEKDCSEKSCSYRHPKPCRYFALYGSCKFRNNCCYLHVIPHYQEVSDLKIEIKLLNDEVKRMEKVIAMLDKKIVDIKSTYSNQCTSNLQAREPFYSSVSNKDSLQLDGNLPTLLPSCLLSIPPDSNSSPPKSNLDLAEISKLLDKKNKE